MRLFCLSFRDDLPSLVRSGDERASYVMLDSADKHVLLLSQQFEVVVHVFAVVVIRIIKRVMQTTENDPANITGGLKTHH